MEVLLQSKIAQNQLYESLLIDNDIGEIDEIIVINGH